jgi:hypothetical protein
VSRDHEPETPAEEGRTPDRTLQVVSVTTADNDLDLMVGDRRAIRTNCDWDIREIEHSATAPGQVEAPADEGPAIHA